MRARTRRYPAVLAAALAVALVVAAALHAPAAAQESNNVYYVEGGLDFAHFTDDIGNGNAQWVAFILSQPANYSLRFDLSRADRWGDRGAGGGVQFTKYFPRVNLGAGISGGGGDFIYPEYRFDAFAGYSFLTEANLNITLGYLHEQSKAANYYDRISVSATWYMNSHWILGGFFNYDMGQPDDNITKSMGLGLTWFTWQERYIGGQFSYGDVNYTQINANNFLVAYEQFTFRLSYSEYFNPTFGATLKFDYGTNKFYDVYGISASVFKTW